LLPLAEKDKYLFYKVNTRNMENNFAEFLKDKLKSKGLSCNKLAKLIDEDGAQVRAWVRGARVPSVTHRSIEKLVEVLSEDKIKIEKLLSKSAKVRKAYLRGERGKKNTENYVKPFAILENLSEDLIITDSRPKCDHGCIKGTTAIGETMIAMLVEFGEQKDSHSKEILLTFQSKEGIFQGKEKLQNKWQNAQFKCIKNGFKITHLIRLDSNESKRTYEFVSNSLQFFEGPGEYKPMYFNEQKVLIPSYGLFLLPEEGLILFSSDQENILDSAIYTKDVEQLKILENHYRQLEKQSTDIFEKYQSYEEGDFVQQLTNSDKELSDRVVLSRRLSEITRPLAWYDENHNWAKKIIEYLKKTAPKNKKIDLSAHIQHRRKRAIRIEDHLKKEEYFCRYIYPKSHLEKFIECGYMQQHHFVASEEERIEQINRILFLLNRYKKYEIALVEEDIYDTIKPLFCEVKGNSTFIMEFLDYKNSDLNQFPKSQWLLAKDRVVVRSFQEFSSKIWQNIKETDRDKYRVKEYLEQGVKRLEDKINSRPLDI
jgi:hypothetical protein